jgi:pyridoxal phosphate enzyme (YggS family)
VTEIAANLARVRARLDQAVADSGRALGAVRLIAVSKFQSTAAIRSAYQLGQRDFGENYVQELEQKAAELRDLADLRWHVIGHLQRNKARFVTGLASLVHTVDSIDLARELDKRKSAATARVAHDLGSGATRLSVLVEVNVAGERQKSGLSPASLPELLGVIESTQSLRLAGLMCVPPQTVEASESRAFFEELSRLRALHGGVQRLPELSMGMSADLEYAVAAGATLVRVGTAIFGARPQASR